MTKIKAFFPKLGTFFKFLKKGRGDLPLPHSSYVSRCSSELAQMIPLPYS